MGCNVRVLNKDNQFSRNSKSPGHNEIVLNCLPQVVVIKRDLPLRTLAATRTRGYGGRLLLLACDRSRHIGPPAKLAAAVGFQRGPAGDVPCAAGRLSRPCEETAARGVT